MGKFVAKKEIPKCDLPDCDNKAYGDFRVPAVGSWANLCRPHAIALDCKIGTGHGQIFIVEEYPGQAKDLEGAQAVKERCKVEPKCNPCVPGVACDW